jgi:hypothetical protein
MASVTLAAADYWRLRYQQEHLAHLQTARLLAELRAAQQHAAIWATLTAAHPDLAAGDQWTLDDATLTLTAPEPV